MRPRINALTFRPRPGLAGLKGLKGLKGLTGLTALTALATLAVNTTDLSRLGSREAVIWDFALVWTRRGLPVRVGCRSPSLSRSPCAFLSA
jgi:hypothetical protein